MMIYFSLQVSENTIIDLPTGVVALHMDQVFIKYFLQFQISVIFFVIIGLFPHDLNSIL